MLTVFGEASAQERVMQRESRRVRPACEGCGIKPGGYSQGLQEAVVLAVARNARRYLANRSDQLWYDEALALERSIGSGLIEGSHRHVLQQRLKLSGAWWLPENAKAMSHLRVQLANNNFDALFPLAC